MISAVPTIYGDFAVPRGRDHCRLVGATRRVAPNIRRIPFQRLGVGTHAIRGHPVGTGRIKLERH